MTTTDPLSMVREALASSESALKQHGDAKYLDGILAASENIMALEHDKIVKERGEYTKLVCEWRRLKHKALTQLDAVEKERQWLKEGVRQLRSQNEHLSKVLTGIHMLLPPNELTGEDGVTHRFMDPNAMNTLYRLKERIQGIPQALKQLTDQLAAKNEAYHERNQVVAALAHIFPSGIARTDIPGWDEEWHGCVYIDLPSGQVSYHYHDSEHALFADLPTYQGQWDGHTKETAYARLGSLHCFYNAAAKDAEIERLRHSESVAWGMVDRAHKAVCALDPNTKAYSDWLEAISNTGAGDAG